MSEAVRLTGRSADQLCGDRDVQTLVRVGTDGSREEMLRVPTALLLDRDDAPEPEQDRPAI